VKRLLAALILATACGDLGCTAAQARVVEADILTALPFVCSIATDVDPSGATLICAILNAAGDIVSTVQVVTPSAAIAAQVVKDHPATPAVAPALKAKAVRK
jgi:hypothetical protein